MIGIIPKKQNYSGLRKIFKITYKPLSSLCRQKSLLILSFGWNYPLGEATQSMKDGLVMGHSHNSERWRWGVNLVIRDHNFFFKKCSKELELYFFLKKVNIVWKYVKTLFQEEYLARHKGSVSGVIKTVPWSHCLGGPLGLNTHSCAL